MNTKQLHYIIAIQKYGTLSEAAKELKLSQPALSKYLSELERELGTELFLRYKKHFYPTPAGTIYIDAAKEILKVKDLTYQNIRERTSSYSETLRIGVSPLRGAIAMAKMIPVFHRHYPNIKIEMVEGYTYELRKMLKQHELDLTLGTCMDPEEKGFRHYSFHEEEPVLFVPAFHPLAKNAIRGRDRKHLSRISIEAFRDTPFLLSAKGLTLRQISDTLFEKHHMQPTIAYESPNNLILKHLAANGAGVALLVDSHMEASEHLVYFHLDSYLPIRICMTAAADRALSKAGRFLIALNFSLEKGNPNYSYHPNSHALEILEEFPAIEDLPIVM